MGGQTWTFVEQGHLHNVYIPGNPFDAMKSSPSTQTKWNTFTGKTGCLDSTSGCCCTNQIAQGSKLRVYVITDSQLPDLWAPKLITNKSN